VTNGTRTSLSARAMRICLWKLRFLALGLLLFLAAIQFSNAADLFGSVRGTVNDSEGAVIEGAAVVATNQDTYVDYSTRTRKDGNYEFLKLPIGIYSVSVQVPGFHTFTVFGIKLDADSEFVEKIVMLPGSMTSAVLVPVQGVQFGSTNMQLNNVVGATQTAELNLMGRTIRGQVVNGRGASSLGTSYVEAPAHEQQQPDQSKGGMAGMDMSGAGDMGDMGSSMAAMAGHMYITPLRPRQPGDEEKTKAVVAQVKASIERYKDYRKALADGYVIGNPKVKQPQYHFVKQSNILEAEHHFDPTKPSALLYYGTPSQRYRLEGVMFTVPPSASEDELNARIPLSIVRWHEHVKFCAAPADKVQEYLGQHPKFGMFGSITTAEACKAEGGTFYPVIFTWMIHVFPYEDNLKDVFSMNDDIPHYTAVPGMPQ
jgi:Carboxypeptidase regulatory-like domain